MKKNNNKNSSARRKLAAAIAMLMISTLLLSSATYAWFTMNKQVSVTSMQVKAHAEEGLLINEIATATSTTWDEQATGNTSTAIELRPASTSDLTAWWHANSKKVDNEAGYGSGTVDTDKTVLIDTNKYYKNISGLDSKQIAAAAGTQAETNIYYEDATFGSNTGSGAAGYDEGEGYYVKYTYYLKSSNQTDLTVAKEKFTANVTASLSGGGSGTSTNLDPALRVGIRVTDNQSTPNTYFKIFAPVENHDEKNYITNNEAGSSYTDYTYAEGETDVILNSTGSLVIPNVNSDGIRVDVYLWFEGEDSHCQSQYLTATLDAYDINIVFKDADLG